MHFLFLSKVPINKPPPCSPTGPCGKSCLFTRSSLHLTQIPHKKFPQIKKYFPSLKDPKKGAPPPSPTMFPQKRGSYGNRRPFPEPYITYPLWSPDKEPSPQFPTYSSLGKRRPIPRALFQSSFRVRDIRAPSGFPSGAPMERVAHLQSLPLHILQGPQ